MHQLGKPDAGRIQSIVGKEWRMLRRILGEMLYTTGPISVLASIRRWGPGGGGECMASGGGGSSTWAISSLGSAGRVYQGCRGFIR